MLLRNADIVSTESCVTARALRKSKQPLTQFPLPPLSTSPPDRLWRTGLWVVFLFLEYLC